ncbi:hypothetical protein [Pseudomonas subflava]|uniref:hypothetical protein n=1 Tax=Pseudomonas subflava TaxID=2952933 RepID=UPI00207A998B|nr:hypothetical protein [Pseudomonas subflava]
MPIAISPTGTSLYDTRPLRQTDDTTAGPLGSQNRLGIDAQQSITDRLELARERAAERAEERQALIEARREELRELQAEQAQQAAEEATQALEDRLRQQQVERFLEAQRNDQALAAEQAELNDPLAPQNLAPAQLEANQLTFGPQQQVTTRVAIEAIATYEETRNLLA